MDDKKIIELFLARNEDAIKHTDDTYGRRLFHLADSIVRNEQDAEESVNDTYLSAWNSIPPQRPQRLSTFLGKLTRNHAIDRWRKRSSQKRGGSETELALEELGQCVSGVPSVESVMIRKEILDCLNRFLTTLPKEQKTVFLCRYWYMNSLDEIARQTGFSVGKIKSMLHRTRKRLALELQKEELQ